MATIGGSAPYAVTQVKHAYGSTSSPTTTSGALVTLPDMSVTLTTTGGDLTATVVCSMSSNTASAILYLALALDGVATSVQPLLSEPSASFGVVTTAIAHWAGVAAGSHTITGQWATSSGTATALSSARALIVEEAKR